MIDQNTEKQETRIFGWVADHPVAMTGIALALGLGVEVLFYGHRLGINFPLWTLLCILALHLASHLQGAEPARGERLLFIPLLVVSTVVGVRLEPLTVFLGVCLTLATFAVLIRSYLSDRLLNYGWLDFVVALLLLPLTSWLKPWRTFSAAQNRLLRERGGRAYLLAVIRGLILAIPILVVFIVLLAAADLVFGDLIREIVEWLDIELLVEWTGRLTFVIAGSVVSLGALLMALEHNQDRKLIGEEGSLIPPFLGVTEAVVILLLVNIVFGVFVVLQFTYLFGGEANISAAGYTYSTYARRGFGELVTVSVLSLGMIMALGAFTKRKGVRAYRWFNGLSTVLVVFLLVILASALRRLLLYEGAFGFTRLRTYTHVAIFWMGALFLIFLLFLWQEEVRRFALGGAVAALGFGFSLAALNVDAFIVERNTVRLEATGDVDLHYLLQLTEDAVPGLADLAMQAPEKVRSELIPQLACWEEQMKDQEGEWQSVHWARLRSRQAMGQLVEEFNPYFTFRDGKGGFWKVMYKGESTVCWRQPFDVYFDN